MPVMPSADEARCVLGAVLADGSWLWRMEAQSGDRDFSMVYCDGETGGRWTLSSRAEPYSWQAYARMLCRWRRHVDALPPGVDVSWIPDEDSRLVTVSGETGLVARILRLCLTLGESRTGLWLAHQSDASLAALDEALPNCLAEPRRLILDELVDWIAELRLPADLLGLCAHYGLGRPDAGLVALRTRLAEEMQRLVATPAARLERPRA